MHNHEPKILVFDCERRGSLQHWLGDQWPKMSTKGLGRSRKGVANSSKGREVAELSQFDQWGESLVSMLLLFIEDSSINLGVIWFDDKRGLLGTNQGGINEPSHRRRDGMIEDFDLLLGCSMARKLDWGFSERRSLAAWTIFLSFFTHFFYFFPFSLFISSETKINQNQKRKWKMMMEINLDSWALIPNLTQNESEFRIYGMTFGMDEIGFGTNRITFRPFHTHSHTNYLRKYMIAN